MSDQRIALDMMNLVTGMTRLTLQVFGKGAKFSLYKPAEEMVYISLDNESRTKGKAAIDVVGAQTGKSTGSILQQVSSLSFISTGQPDIRTWNLYMGNCKQDLASSQQ